MRIEIINNSSSSRSLSFLGSNLSTLISQSETTIASLQSLKSFSNSMNGGIGLLQGAVDSIDVRIKQEETRKSNLINTQTKINDFVELVNTTDAVVSEQVTQNQDEFYHLHTWAKPSALSVTLGSWYNNAKTWLSGTLKEVSDAIGHAWNVYNETDYSSLSDEELKNLCDKYLEMLESSELSQDDKTRLQSFLDFLSKTEVTSSMSDSDKKKIELFNSIYEKLHTYEAGEINSFFNKSAYNDDGSLKPGIKDEDINNIKFISYNSKEPCHTIFFDNINDCEVATWCNDGSIDGNKVSHYNNLGSVFYNLSNGDGINNPRGAYNTFFHEIGHFIDDNLANGRDGVSVGNGLTRVDIFTLKSLNNGDFFSVLRSDVEDSVRNYVEAYNDDTWLKIDDSGQKKIIAALLDRRNALTLNPRLKVAYQKIYADYTGKYGMGGFFDIEMELVKNTSNGLLDGVKNDMISDIFGGVTNNSLVGDYSHAGSYGGDYWYDKKGNPTGMQNMEFFAEYFAYEMTNSPNANNARRYFKHSYSIMDEAMKEEAQRIRGSK